MNIHRLKEKKKNIVKQIHNKQERIKGLELEINHLYGCKEKIKEEIIILKRKK